MILIFYKSFSLQNFFLLKNIFLKIFSPDRFLDLIFINDYYYIYEHIQKVIWKKPNNKQQATKLLSMNGSGIPGRTLKSALSGELIVINNEKSGITFVELLPNGEAGDIKQENIGEELHLKDFVVFGEKDDHLAVLTLDKHIYTLKFQIEKDHIKIERQNLIELKGMPDRKDIGFSLSPCPKSHFMAVSLLDEHRMASSIEIYDIRNEELIFRASLDIMEKGLNGFSAFDFYGYFENEVILTAISKTSPSARILTYYFNVNNNYLREAVPRKGIACGSVHKFVRVRKGGELHVTDDYGKLFNVYYD